MPSWGSFEVGLRDEWLGFTPILVLVGQSGRLLGFASCMALVGRDRILGFVHGLAPYVLQEAASLNTLCADVMLHERERGGVHERVR